MADSEFNLEAEKLIAELERLTSKNRPTQGAAVLDAYRTILGPTLGERVQLEQSAVEAQIQQLEKLIDRERRTSRLANAVLIVTVVVASLSLFVFKSEGFSRVEPILFLVPAGVSVLGLVFKLGAERNVSSVTGALLSALKKARTRSEI